MRVDRYWIDSLLTTLLLLSIAASTACSGAVARIPSADEKRKYESILNLSVLMLRSEQYGRARAGFELLLEIDPMDPRGWDGLASVSLRRNDLAAARTFLERALTCDPRYDFAIAHFGLLEELESNQEQAEQLYRRALTLNPLNQIARVGLARVRNRGNEIHEKYKLEIVQSMGR